MLGEDHPVLNLVDLERGEPRDPRGQDDALDACDPAHGSTRPCAIENVQCDGRDPAILGLFEERPAHPVVEDAAMAGPHHIW